MLVSVKTEWSQLHTVFVNPLLQQSLVYKLMLQWSCFLYLFTIHLSKCDCTKSAL